MPLSLKHIDDYIHALLTNAESLIEEVAILFQNGFYARAFTLSHIAREELSKCLMLHSAGVKKLAGHPVDEKKLMARLRDHKAKLTAEHVQTSVIIAALGATNHGIELLQSSSILTEHRNNRKNTSLYVGLKDEVVSTPTEQFSSEQASRNIALATDALTYQKNSNKLMGKLSERKPISIPRIEPGDINIESMTELLEELAKAMKPIIDKG
jgi:AbiV family abortive infection protein